jgi:hypothetical protein
MEKPNYTGNQENNLFIICPAGRIESAIRQKYSNKTYFLTSLGGVVRMDNYIFAEEFGEFLKNRSIRSLTIAQDIQCRFIQTIILGKPGYGTYAEEHFRNLWIENFFEINDAKTSRRKAANLAKAHISYQIESIRHHSLLGNIVQQQGVRLKGLIVDTHSATKSTKYVLTP